MDDVNCAWDFFYNVILMEANTMCPITVRHDHPAWFNTNLIKLSTKRDNLYSMGWWLHNNDLMNYTIKKSLLLQNHQDAYK